MKRKLEHLDDEPHLPAEMWANILEFCGWHRVHLWRVCRAWLHMLRPKTPEECSAQLLFRQMIKMNDVAMVALHIPQPMLRIHCDAIYQLAAELNRPEILDQLVRRVWDLDIEYNFTVRPAIKKAIHADSREAIVWIIERCKWRPDFLRWTTKRGNVDQLVWFTEKFTSGPEKYAIWMGVWACSSGSIEMVRYVHTTYGLSIRLKCLEAAIASGSLDIIRFLMEELKFDPVESYGRLLEVALVRNHRHIAEHLVDRGTVISHETITNIFLSNIFPSDPAAFLRLYGSADDEIDCVISLLEREPHCHQLPDAHRWAIRTWATQPDVSPDIRRRVLDFFVE
jgi:hypothetical protein